MIGADDVLVLLEQFEGWTIERVDASPAPDPANVLTLRAPDGRVAWVALSGAFGQSLIKAWELKAGHRLLTRIEHAKWLAEQAARTTRIDARREASLVDRPMPPESSVDDCPAHGILRPVVSS